MNAETRKRVYCAGLGSVLLVTIGVPLAAHLLASNPQVLRSLSARWRGAEYLGEEGVIRQNTPYDCGVACLRMVAQAMGKNEDAAAIRGLAGTTADGTSLLGLKSAAENLGLPASTWRLRSPDLASVRLPLIAFVDGNHFVVVREVSDGYVIVLDPASGRLKHSVQSFAERWSGEALIFARTPSS